MESPATNETDQRLINLETLAWSMFRALETYITISELETAAKTGEPESEK